VVQDYQTLKDFADNASHEMQTPLAIINSKLDLMIQEQHLSERQMSQLQAMYDAVGRLSKLNQSLLLLTKLENNQFAHTSPVQLDSLIRQKWVQFEDLIEAKRLRVSLDLQPVLVNMNEYLADILLNNLFSNAIRHNTADGSIEIGLSNGQLSISNTGSALHFDRAGIFDRFAKNNYSEGTGLGLAISRQICDNHHFSISYSFREPVHSFAILFNTEPAPDGSTQETRNAP
jgi:signal transduction histidine kinase